MILNNRELSVLFTLLCYMIRKGELLTNDEQALYDRFINDGWVDTVNNTFKHKKGKHNVSA